VDAHGLGRIVGLQPEGVVAQIFTGLDVVLVTVGPVEFDLLALIRDRVDARPIDALGQKVALGIVAAEEAVEVVVDLVLKPADIGASPRVKADLELAVPLAANHCTASHDSETKLCGG
jgi:hypothetical protein